MDDDMAVDDSQPRVYIWGTRICVLDVQRYPYSIFSVSISHSDSVCRSFRSFVTTFSPNAIDEDEVMLMGRDGQRHPVDRSRPYYMERLFEIDQTAVCILHGRTRKCRTSKKTVRNEFQGLREFDVKPAGH